MLGVLVVIAGVSWALYWRAWYTSVSIQRDHLKALQAACEHLSTLADAPEKAFSLRMLELEDSVERLPRKWEDIKREALAAEARARAHIKRAQKELSERGLADPGVDQLGRELSLLDGDGGEESGLSAVPQDVAVAAARDPEPEDWAEVARNHKFGG